MNKSLKQLLIDNSQFAIVIALIISVILTFIFGIKSSFAYLVGVIINIINFIINGILIDRFLLSNKFLIKLGYVARVAITVILVIPFSKELSLLLSYIGGFITYHVCLIIYWIFIKKGSE